MRRRRRGGLIRDVSEPHGARRLAEVQGGWAKVEPRDGGGSSFMVFLPAGEAADQDVGARRTGSRSPSVDEVEHDPNRG